jgi:Uma2 family endonuclease
MELFPRPIELRLPIAWKAFRAFHDTFWWPEMWAEKPTWRKAGFWASLDHQDVQMNLWSLFGELCHRHGGRRSGRVDIALSESAAVTPDLYYFGKSRQDYMIEKDYFCGAPDLIAEVLAPASIRLDRGPRKELYRRSGVPHLWLLDPDRETVEVYELADRSYEHQGTYAAGEQFAPALFPGETVAVDPLFRTQCKKDGDTFAPYEGEPVPEWLLPPEQHVGLEYFFLLGHPERRWEIWGNQAPSVLAFGSATEAKARLQGFLHDACAWEGLAEARAVSQAEDIDQAEVGRFQFRRQGRHVHLDLSVDARKYRELLNVWARRDVWDWGERQAKDP